MVIGYEQVINCYEWLLRVINGYQWYQQDIIGYHWLLFLNGY